MEKHRRQPTDTHHTQTEGAVSMYRAAWRVVVPKQVQTFSQQPGIMKQWVPAWNHRLKLLP